MTDPPTVALVGMHGHGASHLRRLDALHRAGHIRLAALCDRRTPTPADLAGLAASPKWFADHRALLDTAPPDVTVIATPPHTHLAIASDAALAGSDLLLEKPPVTSPADHDRLTELLARTGRLCQVGFQHLGSAAAGEVHAAVADGRLGRVTGIAVAGRWVRTDAYYRRAAWAGRRRIDGAPTADGALTNPFAHAVMQGLALAEAAVGDARPRRIEVELYRAREIEVDDTSCLRVDLADGLRLVVAVTLCATESRPPLLTVRGDAGTAELEYTTGRLRLPGDEAWREASGRTDLLLDLLAARREPADRELLVPLSRTAPFTAVLAAVLAAQPATRIDPRHYREHGAGEGRQVVVDGVDEAIEQAAERLAGFRDVAAPWTDPAPGTGASPHSPVKEHA